MVRLVCALLLLGVAIASASESRIVGGYPSSVEKYPSILQIQRSLTGVWSQHCAGVILTSGYALSSAGCFVGPNFIVRLRRILAGSSVRNVGGQVSGVARIVKHPSWNEGLTRDGDIVVIQLETPLQYSNVVQQATILGQGVFVPDNMPATQIGWGMTFNEEFPSVFAKNVQEAQVATINNQRCYLIYSELPIPQTVTPDMICAGAIGESGACIGDRGGPLFVNDVLIGLISFGHGCARSGIPTVHTAISSFTNWIISNVN